MGAGLGGAVGDDQSTARSPWTLILRALGAIAAGIGALGFVTLAGGLVLFERFDGLGLPAEHAVAVVPRTDLLVVGASSLVPLALLVGVVVLVLWLVLEAFESRQSADGDATGRDEVASSESEPGRSESGSWLVETAKRSSPVGMKRVAVIAAAAAGGTIAYIFLGAGKHVSQPWHLFLLGAIVVGGALLWLVGWLGLSRYVDDKQMTPSNRFAWFSVLVASLVFVVAGLVNWVQSREVPLVRPAVLETTSHTIVDGLFIADGSDGVYIGEVAPAPGPEPTVGAPHTGDMLHFPRLEVLRLSVGVNQSLWEARKAWPTMARALTATIP